MLHHESAFKLLKSALQSRKIVPEAARQTALILEQEFPERIA